MPVVRPRSMLRVTTLSVFLTWSAACADSGSRSVTVVELPGGIQHVQNTPTSADTVPLAWRFDEELVLSVPDTVSNALVRPSAVVRGRSGFYVVADVQPRSLKMFDGQGKFVRTIGREGGGPGEYRYIQLGIHVDTIIVFDPTQRRVTWYAPDGSVLRLSTAETSIMGPSLSVTDSGDLLIARTGGWLRVSPSGEIRDSLLEPPAASRADDSWEFDVPDGPGGSMRRARERIPFKPTREWTMLTSGELIHGTTDRYDFVRSRSGRDTVRLISSVTNAVAISDSARTRAFQQAQEGNGVLAYAELMRRIVREGDIPRERPLWSGLKADDRGRLWVSLPSAERAHARWEVFDSTGVLLGRVVPPHRRFALGRWSGGRFILIDEDADGRPVVRIYRVDEQPTSRMTN